MTLHLVATAETKAPAGFAVAEGSGLIVPEEFKRLRLVVEKDAWKALNRAISKFLGPHRVRFALRCDVEGCPDPEISRERDLDGTMLLRCGHADRVFASWV
jgi:hypothetical protein